MVEEQLISQNEFIQYIIYVLNTKIYIFKL